MLFFQPNRHRQGLRQQLPANMAPPTQFTHQSIITPTCQFQVAQQLLSRLPVSIPHIDPQEKPTGNKPLNNHQGTTLPVRLPPPPFTSRRVISSSSSSTSDSDSTPQKTTGVRQPTACDQANQDKVSASESLPDIESIEKIIQQMNFNFETGEFMMADLAGFSWPDAPSADVSPAGSPAGVATPHSTESEQSAALDPQQESDDDFEFFELDKAAIATNDLPSYSQSIVPDQSLAHDPTIVATFGSAFSHFGDLAGLGADATTQLGLSGLLTASTEPTTIAPTATRKDSSPGPERFYESLFGAAPPTVEPSALISPPQPDAQLQSVPPPLKRKLSDASDDSASSPAKRPRGRPPKARSTETSVAKRPVKRPSKSGKLDTPSSAFLSLGGADSEPGSPKLTSTGKPSTARPKSVVPERYLRDGTAQKILGMAPAQIAKYPTFEDLLRDVEPSKQEAAAELGAKIADQRDKAADAAKKSRDERRAKIDTLEKKVSDLTMLLTSVAARGALSSTESALLVALTAEE